jgi:ribosomal protein L11 methylase PrmA
LVLANLPLPVQFGRVTELSRLTSESGSLILSGFRDTQETALLERYQDLGWGLERRLSRDEWAPELPPERSFTWAAWLLRRVQ